MQAYVVPVKKVGAACLGSHAKPFGSAVTVQAVLDTFLTLYQGLRLQRVDIFVTDAELASGRTSLNVEDLLDLNLVDVLRFGLNYVAYCGYLNANSITPITMAGGERSTTTAGGRPTPLPSAFDSIMAAAPHVLSPRASAERLDFDIYNALLKEYILCNDFFDFLLHFVTFLLKQIKKIISRKLTNSKNVGILVTFSISTSHPRRSVAVNVLSVKFPPPHRKSGVRTRLTFNPILVA